MITNIQLITGALQEIGVISEAETPSADQAADALRTQNELLAQWEEDGLKLQYFEQTATGDDCPIPSYAERGVKLRLAIALAPQYGATVSPELATNAMESFKTIERRAMNDQLQPVATRNIPFGEGQLQTWDITNGSS